MGQTILKINNLNTIYKTKPKDVHAVNGLDLEIKEGETVGIVGETGAGKTTTALSIMGLLPERTGRIIDGEIYYKGENLLKKNRRQMRKIRGSEISMVFQDPMTALDPIMPIGKQILESLKIHNYEKKSLAQLNLEVDNLLNMVGIPSQRKNEFPHQLSGGMRQRIVIAMALACNPKLLIADEPTTALDVTIQAQVLSMMQDLKKRLKTSIILITHDLGVVANTCDSVYIMYAGRVVEKGPIQKIFEGSNHHPYTEGLFGAIPDIEAEVERLKPIEGAMPDPTNLPKGCSFYPRCKHRMEICEKEQPKMMFDGEHGLSCFLYQKEDINGPTR
ncbi:MAG: ABC transporter ATP-binding protein [Clostridiales bacterium]|jgi:peptide/nickel transport system ATP-binding protein|nr:ABC transporter ATP-binding protein [Clostridiales bacterium]